MATTLYLKKLGELQTERPNLASCMEYVTLWISNADNPAILARICAGAIGLAIDKTAKLPKYRAGIHKPLEYGYICLDRLLEAGITSNVIYEEGTKCLTFFADALPKEEEVQDKMAFLAQKKEDGTG